MKIIHTISDMFASVVYMLCICGCFYNGKEYINIWNHNPFDFVFAFSLVFIISYVSVCVYRDVSKIRR